MTAVGSLQMQDTTVHLHDVTVTPRLCHKAAVKQQKELE